MATRKGQNSHSPPRGAITARVNHRAPEPAPLDFSYFDIVDVADIATIQPRTGVIYTPSTSPPSPSKPAAAADPEASTPAAQSQPAAESPDAKTTTGPIYRATALKLSSNRIANIEPLVPLIHTHVFRPLKYLTWLDLSFNNLTTVPEPISTLPLHTLNLHSNKLADIHTITHLRKSSSLRRLTANGNPMQAHKHYRHAVLSVCPQLVSLDFAAVTPGDKDGARMYKEMFVSAEARRKEKW